MTKKDEEALKEQIAMIESDEDQLEEERQGNIDWMIEELCEMDSESFKNFIRATKAYRRARAFRKGVH